MTDVFTTGEVGKLCSVAPRTAVKWIDSGLLCGFKIPGSKERRVGRQSLLSFMAEYGYPEEMINKAKEYVKGIV